MKNKKKILAIVLMGLLVLTLVPAAVFAGYGSQQGQGIGYALQQSIFHFFFHDIRLLLF